MKAIGKYFKLFFNWIGVFFCGLGCVIKTKTRGKYTKPNKAPVDKPVIALGNGPSLKDVDVVALSEKYDMACVNLFATSNEDFFKIKPKFYFLVDLMFFRSDERALKLYDILEKIDWDMELVIPQGQSLSLKNKHIHIEHYSSSVIYRYHFYKFQYYLYSRNLATCGVNNVLVIALLYLCMKKYTNIYFAGAEMSFFKSLSVDERNHVLITREHFYENRVEDMTENGLLPPGGFNIRFGIYSLAFNQFKRISMFAKRQGINIRNLTLNSFVDCFEKISWETLL